MKKEVLTTSHPSVLVHDPFDGFYLFYHNCCCDYGYDFDADRYNPDFDFYT